MPETTTTRTPARIVLAFLLIVASSGIAIASVVMTQNMEPTIVGRAMLLPNRVFEVVIWVLVAGLALFRNRPARILLLVMTMATASVFINRPPYPVDPAREALWLTVDFALRLAACALLFTRRADLWFARFREEEPEKRSVLRTFYVLGTSVFVVISMSFALAFDGAAFGWDQAIFGLVLWGIAVAIAVAYMMVPRVGWGAKLAGLVLALAAPVIARLLHPLLAPLAGYFG